MSNNKSKKNTWYRKLKAMWLWHIHWCNDPKNKPIIAEMLLNQRNNQFNI